MRLKITGGRLYDPASGWHGEDRDLCIDGDRLVARLTAAERTIDARGRAVLAGGIDLRAQVASCGVNLLHLFHDRPTLSDLGLAYASLGYTHVHEPFLTLITAGLVQRHLAALPVVDTSASLALNLRDLDVWLKDRDRWPEISKTISFLLEKTRCLDVRLVEPFVRYRQDFYSHRALNPVETLDILTRLAQNDKLKFTLEAGPEVLKIPFLEPRAFHLAALGQALLDDETMAAALAHLEAGVTADCGLSLPCPEPQGPPVKIDLGWYNPLDLRPAASPDQVRRTLNLALRHQGGGLAFSAWGPTRAPAREYAEMFAWLLDRGARRTAFGDEVDAREFNLSEWAWATRTLPAQVLGFSDRGHLKPGARADVAIYDLPQGGGARLSPASLSRVHTLIKAGEIVVDNFQFVKPTVAKAGYFRRTGAQATVLLTELCQYRSFRMENLWVPDELGGPWVGLD